MDFCVRFLLDTNVVSDIARGLYKVKAHYLETPPPLIGVSAVTVEELYFGLRRKPDQMRKIAREIEGILGSVQTIPFDAIDAHAAGRLEADLERAGTPMGQYDLLIAGTALARDLIVVTADLTEFSRAPGLRLVDWRTAPTGVREERPCYGAPMFGG